MKILITLVMTSIGVVIGLFAYLVVLTMFVNPAFQLLNPALDVLMSTLFMVGGGRLAYVKTRRTLWTSGA